MSRRVLVLLAARDGADVIRRQIISVLAQQGVSVTINVRDDASADATRTIVAALAAIDPRVNLLPDHNASGSASANFFRLVATAEASSFDFVAFCDQDDEWFPDKLARAADALKHSNAEGYSAATVACWPDGCERIMTQATALRGADYLFEGAGQGCTFVMSQRLFKILFDAVARFPMMIAKIHYHDWIVFALARSHDMGWYIDREPVMRYYQHAANDTGARQSLSGVVRRLTLISSGWYREQVNAVCRLVLAENPGDIWAQQWLDLSRCCGWNARFSRLLFVLRHGRRRLSDRLIQAAAVMTGRL